MNKGLGLDVYAHESDVVRTPPSKLPFVTIVIPCRNEEKHIARCLDSILANDYLEDSMEILVLDGMSEDKTREIVADYEARFTCIRLVDNPQRSIPAAMNVGIRNAKGDTIMKMDAHSIYQRNHISLCVHYQEEYNATNVGGVWRMVPGSDTAAAQAIVLSMAHRFGSGNARIKVGAGQPTWSDSVAFGCYRKELFSRIGLFDERLKGGSDMDMNVRIRAAGGKILLVPLVVVNYTADSDLKKFWKHNFADGVWTSYVMKFGRKASCWRHWVPAAFVLSVFTTIALSALWPFLLWAAFGIVGIYAAASLAVSAQIAMRGKDFNQLFLLPAVFAARHVAHGCGVLFGLLLIVLPGEHWKGRRGSRK